MKLKNKLHLEICKTNMNKMDPLEYKNKEYKTKYAYPSYVL